MGDAAAFETALAKMPQAITVAAGSWQLHGGGIFHGCSGGLFGGDNTLDHGEQAGARKVSSAFLEPTTPRRLQTNVRQMAWHASHTPRRKPLAESVAFSSTLRTRLVWQQLTHPLWFKACKKQAL